MGDGDDVLRTDAYMRAWGTSGATVDMGTGNDTIILGDSTLEGKADVGSYGRIIDAGTIKLGDGNDTLTANGNVFNALIEAGAGNDTVTINGSLGNSTVNGGEGSDTLSFGGASKVSLSSVLGFEHVILTGKDTSLQGVSVANMVKAGVTSMTIDGDAGTYVNIGTTDRQDNIVDTSAGSTGGTWVKGGTADGYTTYTNGAYSLKIDTDIIIF